MSKTNRLNVSIVYDMIYERERARFILGLVLITLSNFVHLFSVCKLNIKCIFIARNEINK